MDRKYLGNEESVSGWQIIYCSLSLIMVVIFVMLVSYSVADRRKMNDLRGTVAGDRAKVGKNDHKKMEAGLISNETLNDGAWVNSAIHSLSRVEEISGLKGNVTVERFYGGMKFKFNSDVVFSSGSATISEKIYPYLGEMIRIALERSLSVRVEGHTDDVPVRNAEFPSNWELSTARSTNVIRHFITKCGFPAKRLSAEGFAQYRPLAPNSSPEGREKNRRIDVYLEKNRDETSLKDQNHESKNR